MCKEQFESKQKLLLLAWCPKCGLFDLLVLFFWARKIGYPYFWDAEILEIVQKKVNPEKLRFRIDWRYGFRRVW